MAEAPRALGGPVERQHASDQVFREIASAILRRELEPGAPLPPERELSERFGVSRIVVREAIHRLKEYELVRVRQGSPTMVLDPDEATDIRLLSLEIELMPDVQSLIERQRLGGAMVLELAEQRMSDSELDAIERTIEEFLAVPDKAARSYAFERAFWTAIAKGARNRIYLRETLWFFNLMQRQARFREPIVGEPAERAQFYMALVVALRRRDGAAELYLRTIRDVIAAQPAPALQRMAAG